MPSGSAPEGEPDVLGEPHAADLDPRGGGVGFERRAGVVEVVGVGDGGDGVAGEPDQAVPGGPVGVLARARSMAACSCSGTTCPVRCRIRTATWRAVRSRITSRSAARGRSGSMCSANDRR